MRRIGLDVSEELYRVLKLRAIDERRTLSASLRELIETALAKEKPAAK